MNYFLLLLFKSNIFQPYSHLALKNLIFQIYFLFHKKIFNMIGYHLKRFTPSADGTR